MRKAHETSAKISGTPQFVNDVHVEEFWTQRGVPLEEIRDYLGVDSLGYLSEEGLRLSVAAPNDHCYACFNRNYPFRSDVGGEAVEHGRPALPNRS